jgi:hypothetical protein
VADASRQTSSCKFSRPSHPVKGDHTDAIVRWPDTDFIQQQWNPASLRIRLKNADLYSYWTDKPEK